MLSITGLLIAIFCAALFAASIYSFLRALEGPEKRKVYSVDKRPLRIRIRAFFHRGE